jgi:DNA-binding CsgD family transcriptional regulator
MVLLPAVFLVIALFQKDDFKRRKNMAFIAAWQICVMVFYLVPLSWLQITVSGSKIDLLAFLFFLMPLLPLWVADIFHRKSIRLYPAEETLSSLESLFEKFGISPREGEVLEMILAGKSQKEIEGALFISGKTDKSHLYGAYKKLGVKNRIQLLNLRQNLHK